MTPIRRILGAVASVYGLAVPHNCDAQSNARVTADTGTSLTADMRLLDRQLLARTREPLERWGNTFLAFAMYVPGKYDRHAVEVGLEHGVEGRQPSVWRDSLRTALRHQIANERSAPAAGIIVDSIAGPVEEAIDGVDGPDFARSAITVLEDRSGRCRRVEREYHFGKDTVGTWGFGRVIYGPPRITRCEPVGYWAADSLNASVVEVEQSRPRLAVPIVRPLDISSLGVDFLVTGDFHGRLTIFDDSIVVRLDSLVATRQLPRDTITVVLDSIRVGVGVGTAQSWSPIDDSRALRIGHKLPPRRRIVRHSVRFVLPHRRRDEDAAAWIVVTFHITRGHPGDADYSDDATTYAHSKTGILADNTP